MPKLKKSENLEVLEGKIQKIFYEADNFTCGIFTSGVKFQIQGVLLKDWTKFLGYYSNTKKYGKVFVIKDVVRELDGKNLALFLSSLVLGVGPAKAEKLSKEGLEILNKYPEIKHKYPFYSFLLSHGVALSYIDKIYKKYGGHILETIKKNPYWLIGKLKGFGFKRADYFALRLGVDKKDTNRIDSAINYVVKNSIQQGSSCIKKEDLIFEVNKLLHIDSLDSEQLIKERLEKSNLADLNNSISFKQVLDKELFIKDLLSVSGEVKNLEVNFSIQPFSLLNEGQKKALNLCINNKYSIITGPAGSGKSFLINSLIKYLELHGKSYVLCASTGKAAKKIEEYTTRKAHTLHKLLKYNGVKYNYKDGDLKTDFVIIDETSMSGIETLYNFLKFISKSTQVVLIGDYHQLPSVEYGNVLKDLLEYHEIPRVVLTDCVRQAGLLRENSFKVLQGEVPPGSEHPWYKITKYSEQQDIYNYIRKIYKTSIREKLNLDPIKDTQLLTPIHKGLLGTISLNKLIQEVIHGAPQENFMKGDKIICHKNNYDLDIMNGTICIISDLSPDTMIVNTLDGSIRKIPKKYYKDFGLAYALTVHKYQGDQIPFTIFICHKSHSYVHSRNLLYTAVTRATHSVAIIGDSWSMTNCVSKISPDKRNTFLSMM